MVKRWVALLARDRVCRILEQKVETRAEKPGAGTARGSGWTVTIEVPAGRCRLDLRKGHSMGRSRP